MLLRQEHPIGNVIADRTDDDRILISNHNPFYDISMQVSKSSKNLCFITSITWSLNIIMYILHSNLVNLFAGFMSILGFYGAYNFRICSLSFYNIYIITNCLYDTYILVITIPWTLEVLMYFTIDMLLNFIVIQIIGDLVNGIAIINDSVNQITIT